TRLADVARAAGVEPEAGFAEVVVVPKEAEGLTHLPVMVFDASVALKSLALRVSQQYGERPSDTYSERRMTTGEMLDAGVMTGEHRNFSIRLTAPLELPEADLLVDPYVLGAWL